MSRTMTSLRILTVVCTMWFCLCTTKSFAQQTSPSPATTSPRPTPASPTPEPVTKTNAPATPAPTEVSPTPVPTAVPDTPAPTLAPTAMPTTPGPTAMPTTAAPTTPGPSPAPTPAPTYTPTMSPTLSPTRFPGTFAPTPPPTFSYNSYCERPYSTNTTNVPCVDMVSSQDIYNGAGAFFDETGCEDRSHSVVGCNLNGIQSCRLCVFNRGLYSESVLNGSQVPFVDCPCCVPDLYGLGGDIDCDFPPTPAPVPAPKTAEPVSKPTEESSKAPTVSNMTMQPTVPPAMELECRIYNKGMPFIHRKIPMFPCERGAGGALPGNSTLCVDLANEMDKNAGIGYYYEAGCEGLGCDIFGEADCRQCLFDRAAYAASGQEGGEDLMDCPCCVPMVYKIMPEETDCLFPPTPAPSPAPTTLEELLAATSGRRGTSGNAMAVMGALAASLLISTALRVVVVG